MDKRLSEILAAIFRLREDEIKPDLKKADVGRWDSLTQMDLVVSLEKEYSIVLGIGDIVGMVSVAHIVDALKKNGVQLAN